MPTIDQIQTHFEAAGFGVREHAFFGSPGVWVSNKPLNEGPILVSEGWLFLYPEGDHWIVRVTPHTRDARHWVRAVTTMDELDAVVLKALRSRELPPQHTEGWSVAP